jgi:hypothetical protein
MEYQVSQGIPCRILFNFLKIEMTFASQHSRTNARAAFLVTMQITIENHFLWKILFLF